MRNEIPMGTSEDRLKAFEDRGYFLRIFTVAGTGDVAKDNLKEEVEGRIGLGTKYVIYSLTEDNKRNVTTFDVFILA